MTYTYDPRTEAVAGAIAKAQGWDLGDDAYSVIQTPGPRSLEYWNMALAAIQASESEDLGIAEARDILADRYPDIEWKVLGSSIGGHMNCDNVGGWIDIYCRYTWYGFYLGKADIGGCHVAGGRGGTPLEAVEATMAELRSYIEATAQRIQTRSVI
jgi:hypothetical protein